MPVLGFQWSCRILAAAKDAFAWLAWQPISCYVEYMLYKLCHLLTVGLQLSVGNLVKVCAESELCKLHPIHTLFISAVAYFIVQYLLYSVKYHIYSMFTMCLFVRYLSVVCWSWSNSDCCRLVMSTFGSNQLNHAAALHWHSTTPTLLQGHHRCLFACQTSASLPLHVMPSLMHSLVIITVSWSHGIRWTVRSIQLEPYCWSL